MCKNNNLKTATERYPNSWFYFAKSNMAWSSKRPTLKILRPLGFIVRDKWLKSKKAWLDLETTKQRIKPKDTSK